MSIDANNNRLIRELLINNPPTCSMWHSGPWADNARNWDGNKDGKPKLSSLYERRTPQHPWSLLLLNFLNRWSIFATYLSVVENFPTIWKLQELFQFIKKGSRDQFSNYRPISILPIFSKLLERLVYDRIVNFNDHFSILHNNQFGFQKSRSTSMALNVLVDKYHQALQDKQHMVGLFIDLSRAFDTLYLMIYYWKSSINMVTEVQHGPRGRVTYQIENYVSRMDPKNQTLEI